jgi:lysophospholipase L1-like esterase
VDGAAPLRDADGGLDPRYHVGDGLHLDSDGQRLWRAALAPALAPWRSP